MKISVLTVEKNTPPGKKYVVAEVRYKNLTFGKVESKKIFSFGAQEQAFKALGDAKAGDVFEVEVKKNDQGYNDWVKVVQAPPGGGEQTSVANAPAPRTNNSWESAEERAKKQVLIVKQSSLSSAIAALSVGAKTTPPPELIIKTAQAFTDWVTSEKTVDLFSVPNDLPQDIQVE